MSRKRKTLNVTNHKSIQSMISYLEGVKKDLPNKCEELCRKLADVGIEMAVVSSSGSGLAKYVVFSKYLLYKDSTDACVVMYGKDVGEVFGEGVGAAQISPILMMEYGSGSKGVSWKIVDDLLVGQGTFPGQKHAFDPRGWWYKSEKDGEWHHSYGVTPSYPMQHAYDTMQAQVDSIIRSIDWL